MHVISEPDLISKFSLNPRGLKPKKIDIKTKKLIINMYEKLIRRVLLLGKVAGDKNRCSYL